MGIFRGNKDNNKSVISQILNLVPICMFDSCTWTYQTEKGCALPFQNQKLLASALKNGIKLNFQVDET